jgi:FMN-dependent NADH-azoreductase
MSHLLHIDSSFQGERSISRRLTARAAARWRAAHPDGTVTYRDLGTDPVPHLDAETGPGRMVPSDQRTPAQAASYALSAGLIEEVRAADTILLGLPVYNYGAPSSIKAWVDHLVAPGLSVDPETHAGLLGDRELIVLAARGGGYGPGTPREGWDHSTAWLRRWLADVWELDLKVVESELTLAEVKPEMASLRELAAEIRAAAERTAREHGRDLADAPLHRV